MIRTIFFIIIIILAATGPFLLLLVLSSIYAFKYTAYELLLVAAMIDAFYGMGSWLIPYYLCGTTLALMCLQWLKPHLTMYNQ